MANGYHPRLATDPVWWNGTNINTFTTSAAVGVRTVTLYGWDDRPDVRDVRESRPGQDGEYADNLYLGGRTITIEGEVYGSTWVDLQARKRALAAVVQPASSEVLLKVPDPATASPTAVYASTGMTGYERVSARVVEAIQFGETMDPLCQTWQVIARASDPDVYNDVETSTDSGTTGTATRTVTVDQTGTYATPPTLTVSGPAGSDWGVAEPSSGLSLVTSGLTLVSGETATIGVRERTLDVTATYAGGRARNSSLLAGWMLNETSGTVADNFQGNATYDGTYAGGFTLNQAGPVTGVTSVTLNGSTGKISTAYAAALNTAETTFECWFKVTATGATQYIVYNGTSTRGFNVKVSIGGPLQLTVGTGSGQAVFDAGVTPVSGTWYHVVASIAASTASIYVNGVLGGSNSQVYAANNSAAFVLGSAGASNYFTGGIAAAALYSRAFTAAECVALYAAAQSATPTITGYQYLVAQTARWASLGTASSTYSLTSTGLNTGSKLNVAYRDARL